MIPIRDHNPTHGTPFVTYALIAANVLIFLYTQMQPDNGEGIVWMYGFVPATLSYEPEQVRDALQRRADMQRPMMVRDRAGNVRVIVQRSFAREATAVSPSLRLLTCMFLHGGWLHLLGNMLYLWIFGNNIEDRLGHLVFVVFYLVTGVLGTLAHTFLDMQGLVPLVGASGAISGVLGAYIWLYPHTRVEAIVPIGWYITTVDLPAWVFLGIYAILQILNGLPALSSTSTGGVAYWAHIGGFAAGLVLILVLPKREAARPLARPAGVDADEDESPFFGR